jgi:Arylsulfotransferase (ASST)
MPARTWRGRLIALALGTAAAGCGGGSASGPSAATYPDPVVLFSPIASTSVYLMSLDGQKLHEWTTDTPPGYSVYLLPTGNLLRASSIDERPLSTAAGSNGGRVEMLDWDSKVVWRFDYATTEGQQHHDVYWMPKNGHVLMVAWETHDTAEALAAGRRPETIPSSGELWVDKVVEVDPRNNQVVWEWRVWDHLVPPGEAPSDHPGLIDPNFVTSGTLSMDWTHANAVAYNAALDQVILSVRNFSEFWVIDHGTTTAEAAGHTGGRLGHGGDLVYRWGNPRAFGRLDLPQQLFGQHNPNWIASGLTGAGHILLFNNGDANQRPYSTVVELETPAGSDGSYAYDPGTGYGPSEPVWEYSPPDTFFAPIISGAQRLANGHTFVTDGPAGHFFEVTPDGQTVWSHVVTDTAGSTGYMVFRAVRYEAGYSGLAGRTLTPQGPLRIPVVPPQARATSRAY